MAEPSGTGPAARLPPSGPGWRLAGRGVRLSLREHGKQVSVRTTSDVDQACQEAVLTCTCVAGFQALGDAVGPCRDPRSGRAKGLGRDEVTDSSGAPRGCGRATPEAFGAGRCRRGCGCHAGSLEGTRVGGRVLPRSADLSNKGAVSASPGSLGAGARRGRRCGAVAGAARPSAVVRRALCVVRRTSGGCRVLWGGGGDPVSARPSSACSPAGATLSTRLWTLGTSTPWFGHPLPLRFFTGRHLRSLVKREFGEFFHLR